MKPNPEVRHIFDCLKPAKSWVVGGAVRDYLATGHWPDDIDIATWATPDEVTRLLTDAGLHVVPTGIKHGTVTAIYQHISYEITTLRKDVETNGRHAEVTFTKNVEEDAARRDFTMNALYLDENGDILDFFGGQEDLKKGIVKFIGDARARIDEDYLRILRFFRFHAKFSKFGIAEPVMEVLIDKTHHVTSLSKERVIGELLKFMKQERAINMWPEMTELGVFEALALPQTYAQDDPLKEMSPLWRLFGLYHKDLEILKSVLVFSNAQKKMMKHLGEGLARYDSIEVMAYLYGKETTEAIARIKNIDFTALAEFEIPEFPLQGKDLAAQGVAAGPAMGAYLKEIKSWWLAENFPNHAACLEKLKEMLET